ncbi:MAG: hypothetical protein GY852_01395, partial [bacterium]|nr:hypothetical protein [bacterium]
MFAAIEKAQGLDPSGNLPFVIHAANGAHGTEWRKGNKDKGEDEWVMEKGAAINRETGQMQGVKREFKFRPEAPELLDKGGEYKVVNGRRVFEEIKGREAGKLFSAERSIDAMNNGEWSNKLTEVAQMTKHVDEIMGDAALNLGAYKEGFIKEGTNQVVVPVDGGRGWKQVGELDVETGQAWAYNKMRNAGLFLENAE